MEPSTGGTIMQPQELEEEIPSHRMPPEEAHEKLTGLRIYARSYWDAQKHRIKVGNRAFSGVTDLETIKDIKQSAKNTETLLSKALVANFREEFPEIYQWVQETAGLGPVLMARLLGEIGHPNWAFPSHWEGTGENRKLISDPPYRRNVAKLWAYCGHGDPERKARKGMTDKEVYAMGNRKAKMLVHLLAESCMKLPGGNGRVRSPFRDTYDAYRARYEDRVDKVTGKPWPDGRKHNAALRVVGKEILLELWLLADKTI